jgi:erythromycin esterase-like protein
VAAGAKDDLAIETARVARRGEQRAPGRRRAPAARGRGVAEDVAALHLAHNGHINYGTGGGYVPMGECLRQKFGADYLSIGFAFNQGAFQAIGNRGLSEFSLGPSPDNISLR